MKLWAPQLVSSRGWDSSCLTLNQESANKRQRINILGLVGHTASTTATQLCVCRMAQVWTVHKQAGVVVYKQNVAFGTRKQEEIWRTGRGLLTLTLSYAV